jgi:hypothetical protein
MSSRVVVRCALGVVGIDLEDESIDLEIDTDLPARTPPATGLPLVLDADELGSRIVAVVDRRPPLVVSDDAGRTWREAGGGLPRGRAVAISPGHPDHIAFATAERLHLSRDGGMFWRALAVELPDIVELRWLSGE